MLNLKLNSHVQFVHRKDVVEGVQLFHSENAAFWYLEGRGESKDVQEFI